MTVIRGCLQGEVNCSGRSQAVSLATAVSLVSSGDDRVGGILVGPTLECVSFVRVGFFGFFRISFARLV